MSALVSWWTDLSKCWAENCRTFFTTENVSRIFILLGRKRKLSYTEASHKSTSPEKNERERKTRRLTSQSFKAESRFVVVRMARIQQHKKRCVPVSSIIVCKISRFLFNSSPHVYFKNNKLFFISTASEGSHRSFGVNGFAWIIMNIYQTGK